MSDVQQSKKQSAHNLKVMCQPLWHVGVAPCAWGGWSPCLQHHPIYMPDTCVVECFFEATPAHLSVLYALLGGMCIPCMGPHDTSVSYIATCYVFPNVSLHRQHHTLANHGMNSI